MKNVRVILLFLGLPALLLAHANQKLQQKLLVFTHVTVIDATGAPAKPDMTVVITNDRITALDKTRRVNGPKDIHVVDATGKYLIPGLWDMHVHIRDEEIFLPLFIANGVTGVRNMGRDLPELILQWRKEITNGTLLGPRIMMAGPILTGPKPVFSGSIAVATETEGREAVDSIKRRGLDFVKVYSFLDRDAYFAIADEAKRQGIPFAGHVPASVTAAEASDAGQKSIEHLTGVLQGCSSSEAELRKEALAAIVKSDYSASVAVRFLLFGQIKELEDTYSDKKAALLFARFVKNGTWQTPTLTRRRARAFADDSRFTNDARLKYIPLSWREEWEENRITTNLATEDWVNLKRVLQKHLELVGSMRRAGVELLAGTDSGYPYCFPGFSLHDELALLIKAGLTPMEALQAATRNPAKYLGLLDSLGTVEKGKMADLVLLEANPLQDIGNTQKIAAVVVGGRLILQASLRTMLADVAAAASKR